MRTPIRPNLLDDMADSLGSTPEQLRNRDKQNLARLAWQVREQSAKLQQLTLQLARQSKR